MLCFLIETFWDTPPLRHPVPTSPPGNSGLYIVAPVKEARRAWHYGHNCVLYEGDALSVVHILRKGG
ncbi:hypothetical protein SRHO_G00244680 [Serrasalmus rhombeus]